ncbi:MAG TPA: hypothetical protein VF746_07755 [Longimicrobium sp.]|jgi:hypothetical protein
MEEPPSFTGAIRTLASGLREDAHSHTHLNRAAARIDHLGRRLHGLGLLRDREIADCFTAALRELEACHGIPEEERGEAVRRAACRLDAAAALAREGVPTSAP